MLLERRQGGDKPRRGRASARPRTELKLCPYEPGELGWEKRIKEWLERLRAKDDPNR